MTDTSNLSAVRAAYDAVALDYARRFGTELSRRPLDRAMLAAFAEHVRGEAGGGGRAVADLGCGPGRVTAHLDALGVRAFGVDLSPAMVAVARRTYPGLRFEVGSMPALDIADGVLGGVLACWPPGARTDVHRTPPGLVAERLARAGLAEVARMVREPDGDEECPQGFVLARKP
ncbi:class I SAM-dependent methyltransferase [Streptomyces sp. NPDC058525]|uniref:class I SAM-dependent methyltransferase n=1 Tax=unclassified Streptomyces TaxID=2593676 RepID=UPI003653810B